MQIVSDQAPSWMTAAEPAPLPDAEDLPARDAPTDREHALLVRQALAGDSDAFGVLIDRHERAALAVAYATLRDASLAADAVQEACLKAWHKRYTLADPDCFGGWLLHIVRRCALDQLRSRKPVLRLAATEASPPAGAGADAADELARREMDEKVRQALEELDDDSRLAVVMRYYDNAPARQIAEVLGCSPAAVDMRLKRARDRLRQRLAPDLPQSP